MTIFFKPNKAAILNCYRWFRLIDIYIYTHIHTLRKEFHWNKKRFFLTSFHSMEKNKRKKLISMACHYLCCFSLSNMILLVVIVVRNYWRFLSFFIAITLEFLVNINKIKEIVVVTDTQRVENINQNIKYKCFKSTFI